jgi:hypothetical protein
MSTFDNPRPDPFSISYLNDPECISLREMLENGHSPSRFPETSLRPLYSHLREYEVEQRDSEDYKTAKLAKEFSEQIKSEIHKRAHRQVPPQRLFPIDRRTEFQSQWIQMSEDFDRETNEKRTDLLKRHQQVLERFDSRWSFVMPRQYRKPSHQLLQLKQVEKTLANAGEYDRATEVHEEVDTLTALEQSLAQQKLVQDYRRGRGNIVRKQMREVELFESARSSAKKVMEAKHFMEMNAAINRDLVQRRKVKEISRMKMLDNVRLTRVKLCGERKWDQETLLPPLKPPTDPSIVQEEEERRRVILKHHQMLMKRREEEERAALEMVEKFQKEIREQKLVQKQLAVQTFVTSTESVRVKVQEVLKGEAKPVLEKNAEEEIHS